MTMERTAWLFTRGDDSVRLEVRRTPDGVQLVIEGPGASASTYDFPPGTAVDGFRAEYERKLAADGYRLQVFSERRSMEDGPAPSVERRRG